MTMLFIMGVLLVFAALGPHGHAMRNAAPSSGVARSIELIEAMTTAPSELTRELDKSFGERVLLPLQNRFTGLGRRLSGADSAERIRHKLDLAGNPPGLDRRPGVERQGRGRDGRLRRRPAVLVHARRPHTRVLVIVGVTLAGFFAPSMYLYQKGYDRKNKIQRAMPDAIDLLTISVESGLGFDAAVQQVARNTEGPLADEFSRVLREMQIGSPAARRSARSPTGRTFPSCGRSSAAMVQADAFGIPIATCCGSSRRRCGSSAANGPRRRPSRCRSR